MKQFSTRRLKTLSRSQFLSDLLPPRLTGPIKSEDGIFLITQFPKTFFMLLNSLETEQCQKSPFRWEERIKANRKSNGDSERGITSQTDLLKINQIVYMCISIYITGTRNILLTAIDRIKIYLKFERLFMSMSLTVERNIVFNSLSTEFLV